MNGGEFVLWGIDGELKGSEHLLQMRLPMFTRPDDRDVVYLARRVDWSPELPETDVVRMSADRAAECGDRVVTTEQSITPGQLVVVLGPELLRNLRKIGAPPSFGSETPGGFFVIPMESNEAELYATLYESLARRRFDREIAQGTVTDEARAALAVMRNVAVGDLRNHLIRTLVAHRLDEDTDQYRRVLRLAQRRLRDSAAILEDEVQRHMELSRRIVVTADQEDHVMISVQVNGSLRGQVLLQPLPAHEYKPFMQEKKTFDVLVDPEKIFVNPKLLSRFPAEEDDAMKWIVSGEV
jgi:hypothetical protein